MLEELGSQTRGGKRWCKKCVDICKYTTIIFPICYLGCMSVLQADGTSWDFCDTPIHW